MAAPPLSRSPPVWIPCLVLLLIHYNVFKIALRSDLLVRISLIFNKVWN
jgi:hypothetical protein